MQLTTKYNIGESVWVINGKTGVVVEREVAGLRTQFINNVQKTIYSFLKDRCDPNKLYHDYLQYDPVTEEDRAEMYFWLPEDKCYSSKQELLNSL